MRRHKFVTRQQRIDTYVACDRCGHRSTGYDWSGENYEVDEITVRRRAGKSYPEYDGTTTTTFDICPSCWEWLVAILASEGATPVEYDTEDGYPTHEESGESGAA